MDIFDHLDKKLEEAERAAKLERASFGFPNDRIEVKSVHFGDDRTGRKGDVLHPTDYIKNITELHHSSWIISPIREVREILRLHSGLLRDIEKLREKLETTELLQAAEQLTERAKGNINP